MGHAPKDAADKKMRPFSIFGVAVVVSMAMWCVGAQTVPCTVSHYVDPGERRIFRFQRAGLNQDMLCVFTFQTAADEPIGVAVLQLDFGNVNEKNCTCGSLRIFDVSDTGEQLLSETRCAGETSEVEDGPIIAAQASRNVVVVTLSTNGCPGPQLWFAVGTLTDRELQIATATTDPGGSVTTPVSTTISLVTEGTPVVTQNSSSTPQQVSTDSTTQPKIVERIQESETSSSESLSSTEESTTTDITDLTLETENASTDSDTQTTTELAPSTVNESTEENTTDDDEQITTTESVTLDMSDSSSTGTPFTEGSASDADEQISTTESETLNIDVTTEESTSTTPDEQTSTTHSVAETTSEEPSTTPPLSEFGDRSLTDTTEEQTTYESTTEENEVKYQSEGSSSDFGNSTSEMTSQGFDIRTYTDSTYSTELFETTSSSFEETTFDSGELEVSEQTTDGFDISSDTEEESSSTTSSFDRFTTSTTDSGFVKSSSSRNDSSDTTDFPEITTKAKRRWWPFG